MRSSLPSPSGGSGGGERKRERGRGGKAGSSGKSRASKGKAGKDSHGDKPGESDTSVSLASALDFVPALASGCFSEAALAAVRACGFDPAEAALTARKPIAGRLRECRGVWRLVSSSCWVLGVVDYGYRIQWIDGLPSVPHKSHNPPTTEEGKVILDKEVAAMLEKRAIRVVTTTDHGVISGFFARPKKTPGKFRPIVSLKYTNAYIVHETFRMVTPEEITRWIRPGFFFTSIDLSDAYFVIPLEEGASRFTRFTWRGIVYEYLCIMFGLAPSARVFTKMMHAVIVFLRERFAILIIAYIDDLLIQAPDAATCARHAEITILVLQSLGYGVNFEKSALVPATTVEHLGFIWDSCAMTLSLPQAKVEKIVQRARRLLAAGSTTAADLRSLLGTLESTRLVTRQAALHYRGLQYQLPRPGRHQPFPSDSVITFRRAARADLAWWANTFPDTLHTSTSLLARPTTLEVWTDASGLVGWGGHCSRGLHTQGRWTLKQERWHINKKELEAATMSLEELMIQGDTIKLHMDSMTAVAFVNRQGGTRSRLLCSAAQDLWGLVLARGGWVQAHWVPREDNDQADFLSKYSVQLWDFGLREEVAAGLWRRWFRPSTDLFASSTFHLADEYFSCSPDSQAARVDAFAAASWPDHSYAFPPPPLLSKCLAVIREQQVTVIVVAPRWTAAPWWDTLGAMAREGPVLLGRADVVCKAMQGRRLPRLGQMVAYLVAPSLH